jgi:hypothetical protein
MDDDRIVAWLPNGEQRTYALDDRACVGMAPAGGKLVVVHGWSDRPSMSVYGPDGTRARTISFEKVALSDVVLDPKTERTWVVQRSADPEGYELVRVDLESGAKSSVHRASAEFGCALLDDGRVVLAGEAGVEVLDVEGRASEEPPPPPSSSVSIGLGARSTLEAFLREAHGVASAPFVSSETAASSGAPLERMPSATELLLGGHHAAGRWTFPRDDREIVSNGSVLTTPAQETVRLGSDEKVADVLPVRVGEHRYAAVGTSSGRLLWVDAEKTPQPVRAWFQMPAPIAALEPTDDGAIVAFGRDGSVLVFERGADSSGPMTVPEKSKPAHRLHDENLTVRTDDDHVYLGDVRVDRRPEQGLNPAGEPSGR